MRCPLSDCVASLPPNGTARTLSSSDWCQCVVQSLAELERDRQQLNAQIDTLRQQLADQSRHVTESHDQCDVTEADADRLAAAEQTAARYKEALRLKVVVCQSSVILCSSVINSRIGDCWRKNVGNYLHI